MWVRWITSTKETVGIEEDISPQQGEGGDLSSLESEGGKNAIYVSPLL